MHRFDKEKDLKSRNQNYKPMCLDTDNLWSIQSFIQQILLVRVICEKYRLRGEANFQSRHSRYLVSQITLTNRIYLSNSAEYLTASKTVACKQVQNFRSFDFQDFYQSRKIRKIFLKMCISGTKSKIE
jgi:hypothetical protein